MMKEGSAGNNRSGQSVMEMMIALAIIVVTISTIMIVSLGNRSVLVDTEESAEALRLAEESLEDIRAIGEDDFTDIVPSTVVEGIYTKEILVEDIDAYTKEVTSRVTWDTDPLREQKVELVALLTNRDIFEETGGDTGGGGLTGDWMNPRTLGSVSLTPSGNQGTSLDAIDKIVYLTSNHSNQGSSDFWIIDATNGESPEIKSNLDVGKPLRSVDAIAGYAFTGGDDTSAQLKVVDISNINSPSLAASFQLPSVSGSGAIGNSIFFYNDRIYMGTKAASGPEFHVIDVSNPRNPSSLGSFEIGGDVNAIYVREEFAYLATSLESAELKILNISDPTNITSSGNYNHQSGDDAKSIHAVGNKIYLGKTSGVAELVVLNVSDPASVQNLGEEEINAAVNAITVRDYLSFLGTDESNNELQIWNISDPADISLWSSFNFPQVVTGLDYEDNLVYVSVRSNDALRIITSQ